MSALREIREARGLSQPALARLARTSQQQIDRLEKGQRVLTLAWARRLAPLLGIAPRELRPAEGYDLVPVAGIVADDESVILFDHDDVTASRSALDESASSASRAAEIARTSRRSADVASGDSLAHGEEWVEAPPGEADLAALRVRGNGLSPRYLAGELVFYSRLRGRHTAHCLYADCVVRLADGRLFLKRVEPGSVPGSYTLRSYNPIAPLLMNCEVEWMAPITWRASRRDDDSQHGS
ncbi:MAG TPA: helix-turn-helix domain-containing protein [Alphaproteobacteria bacterium]|nr:helix-turn-helix domain-containing protein [Alphaproteobacteria bacterium]